MTLISLLLVLALERLTTKSELWRSDTYMLPYLEMLKQKEMLYTEGKAWQIYLTVAMPAILFWAIHQWFESSVLILLVNLAVLFIAMGCPHIRANYKGYLQSSNRGDFETRDKYANELKFDSGEGFSFGQHMIWINFRYYFAVAFWFLLLGASGAALYLTARVVESQATNEYSKKVAARVLNILDWLPARLTSMGFLLMGDFNQGIKVFSGYVFDPTVPPKNIVLEVAKACEDVEVDSDDCTEEPCTLLRLAKRNMILLLAAMAVLTLGGWIH